jgi:hypothetical protein
MVVNGPDAKTDAQANRIPPAIRNFVRSNFDGVEILKRYNSDHEHTGNGYVIKCDRASTRTLPDDYEIRKIGRAIMTDASVRVAIRDS